MFRNKALLEWNEPHVPFRYSLKRMRLKDWLKIAAPTFAKYFLTILIGAGVGTLYYRKLSLIEILALAIGGALIMIVLHLWAFWVNPVHISLRENDIQRSAMNGTAALDYKDIQRCTFKDYNFGGTTARVLEVSLTNGSLAEFEIAASISSNEIRTVLQDKRVIIS